MDVVEFYYCLQYFSGLHINILCHLLEEDQDLCNENRKTLIGVTIDAVSARDSWYVFASTHSVSEICGPK